MIISILKLFTHIKLSFLHFGQYNGKFFSCVSFRILILVLLLHIGQITHYLKELGELAEINEPVRDIHSEPLQKICIASLKKAARFPLLNLFIKVVNLSSVI